MLIYLYFSGTQVSEKKLSHRQKQRLVKRKISQEKKHNKRAKIEKESKYFIIEACKLY